MIIHVGFEVQVPRIQWVDDISFLSQFVVENLKFVKLWWKIKILHEEVHFLSLTGEVLRVVLVPLSEVGLFWQEPDWIELLSQLHIAPQRDGEDGEGDEDDEHLGWGGDDHIGDGFEDSLEYVELREGVWSEVLVTEAWQWPIPLLLYSPLINTEPSHEPCCLQDIDHDQTHRAEDTEWL